ncbi:MAG: hypothetical protein WBM54_13490 [Woeseia sp.]
MNTYAAAVSALRLLFLCFLFASASAQESPLIAGQNINMVSGTEWPDGDPFLQRQNEPTIAVSTRNPLHLLAGSNDYRTVDLPGLPGGKTIGDSWISLYRSHDGGGRWTSTLLPGYPQDDSTDGMASPIKGYDASADPVIRAGTHGLFYYSGIAFTRGESPRSAVFLATYIDLNNDEAQSSIEYVGTTRFDFNDDGAEFIDKPWIAVDKPRLGANSRLIELETANGPVLQNVECGNVYAAWARIRGDGTTAVSSDIMFSHSDDCGKTFSAPKVISAEDTINQGAAIAVNPYDGRVQVAWRQFANSTLNCVQPANYWRDNRDAWPVQSIELAGYVITPDNVDSVIVDDADSDDSDDYDSDSDSDDHEWDENFENDWDDDADNPSGVLRQLLAAWLNVLAGANNSEIKQTMEAAEAWLVKNPLGSKPKKNAKKEGNILRKKLRDFNKGLLGPESCETVAATGYSGLNPDAIVTVQSTNAGEDFSAPLAVTGPEYHPFEQGTSEYSFRTTGYPTMTFDNEGRAYIAYSTRGLATTNPDPVSGDARIAVTTSSNGSSWTTPRAIDEPGTPGHQMMPALEFSRGKVFLLYYDFRNDISGLHDRYVVDLPADLRIARHSVDVRAAYADAAAEPVFTDYSVVDMESTQASRYPFLILNENDKPVGHQMLYNPPNLPMFKGGTVPFFGDYVDIAALPFVVNDEGEWDFDNDASRGAPVVHAIWTDNRDVVGPPDNDWTSYVPPGNGDLAISLFDSSQMRPVCSPQDDPSVVDRTKMRNQNVYTARLTQGIALDVPGNNRPLGNIQRAFVAFLQNSSEQQRTFRLEILNQPTNGTASFNQFSLVDEYEESIERLSSIARTVYVEASSANAFVDVRAVEIDPLTREAIPNGLTASARINNDPSAPPPSANNIQQAEFYDPAVFNPAVFNSSIFDPAVVGNNAVAFYNPAIYRPGEFTDPADSNFVTTALAQQAVLNPAVFNPAVFNPAVLNPAVLNPAVLNPAVLNPAILNPAVFNPAIFNMSTANPAVFNPAVFNPAVFNNTIVESVETTALIRNDGNATAAYSLNLDLENPPPGFLYQAMVYKTYLVPSADGCELTEIVEQESLLNDLQPDMHGELLSPDSTSFFVAPGDNVLVTVRVIPDPDASPPGNIDDIDSLAKLNLSQSIVPQAVNTDNAANGETEPEAVIIILADDRETLAIATTALPDGEVNLPYNAVLESEGGDPDPDRSWTMAPGSLLPDGLALAVTGELSGVPQSEGQHAFTVQVSDGDQIATKELTLEIAPADANASLSQVTLSSDVILLGGPVSYTAVITNTGTSKFGNSGNTATQVRLRAWIKQSGAAKRGDLQVVECGMNPNAGEVPPGDCDEAGNLAANNSAPNRNITENWWTDAATQQQFTIVETLTDLGSETRYSYEVVNETNSLAAKEFRIGNPDQLDRTMLSPAGWSPMTGSAAMQWIADNANAWIQPLSSLNNFVVTVFGNLQNQTSSSENWVVVEDTLGVQRTISGTINRRQNLTAGPAVAVFELVYGENGVLDSLEIPVTLVHIL